MSSRTLPRILCIMGSGETAPTMTSVHQSLLNRLGPPPVPAVLLDTPFGFQENADDICTRTAAYFRDNVGFPIEVATFRDREHASALEYETMLARIAGARYVFAGPGSPTYALRQWRDTKVPQTLSQKLREGGCVTFASAAAVGLGAFALSVYEVYKVGEPPRWLDGLDLLSTIGLHVALIPHYNNAEGGTHDTRYCYMGERRLRMLEEQLPDGIDILGVDEHTACVLDLDDQSVTVRGRGGVTWRHRAESRRYESGVTMPMTALAEHLGGTIVPVEPVGTLTVADAGDDGAQSGASPFMEVVNAQSAIADGALARGDVDATVAALLAIDSQIHEWSSDTLDSDEQDQARSLLRRHLVRLGQVAREGTIDPRERIAPLVEHVLNLRTEMRGSGHYDLADRVRDALTHAGVEIRDSPDGTAWDLREEASRR
ncbi:MAG: hypothetical protein JOY80_08230 [Candidatus Dormibacteraeota bacterium]|nr:hypothetical protein [Candidatus Dormibacteraeota bacterium]